MSWTQSVYGIWVAKVKRDPIASRLAAEDLLERIGRGDEPDWSPLDRARFLVWCATAGVRCTSIARAS